jgi:hypothetical protein
MTRGPPVADGLDTGGVTMRYAVLGTGEVGRTLGGKLVEPGHEVSLG